MRTKKKTAHGRREFRKYIADLAIFLRRTTFYGEYSMRIRHLKQQPEPPEPDDGHGSVDAQMSVDPVYLSFVLKIPPSLYQRWKDRDYEHIGKVMAHEIAHLFTAPLQRLAEMDAAPSQRREIQDVTERQTQRITNALLVYLPRRWFTPRRVAELLK